jgi:sulfoquinovose isomerase
VTESTEPGSAGWRHLEKRRLLDFARGARLDSGGFGYLDDTGAIDASKDCELYITSRMTHVFSLASLDGDPTAAALAGHGVTALNSMFADDEYGGWFHSVTADGTPTDDSKTCYDHAFVLLASSTATAAGIDGAPALMRRAQQIMERYFWDEPAGRCRESYDRSWQHPEEYRGANSNMHSVEAFLTTAQVGGDQTWLTRSLRIAEHLINSDARRQGWRIPEHFTSGWTADLDYNRDNPTDKFRPFGSTPGHSFEWSRLLLALEAMLPDPPTWLAESANELFYHASRVGWPSPDDIGAIYTADWQDRPVVDARLFWVMAEAVLAADAVARRHTDDTAAALRRTWWAAIDRYFVDRINGSWWHELDASGIPAHQVWTGKPDVYHAYQATLMPDYPLGPTTVIAEPVRPEV